MFTNPLYAFDPEGPRELITKDGLVVPWRPVLSPATDAPAGTEINPLALAEEGWWTGRVHTLGEPCIECGGTGTYHGPGGSWTCVPCRGEGETPFAFVGVDFADAPIPAEVDA